MVTILDEAPSFGSLAGKALSQGLQTGTSHGIDFANKMKLEQSRGKGLAQEAKNIEKAKMMETGLGTISQMRQILEKGNLGRGSGFSGFFNVKIWAKREILELKE